MAVLLAARRPDPVAKVAGDPRDDFRLLAAIPQTAVASITTCRHGTRPEALGGSRPLGFNHSTSPSHYSHGVHGGDEGWGETHEIFSGAGPGRRIRIPGLAWLEHFVSLTGNLPLEQEEPSTEQLSALHRRLVLHQTPYADFALFGPFGKKLQRTQRFRTFVMTSGGQYFAKELPGPNGIEQWRASYRVYRTALLMLGVITMSMAVAYESLVERLDRLYKGCWHLVTQADDLARGEHILRLKVVTEMEIAQGTKAPPMWNAENPWEALFRRLIKDTEFWTDQVHTPANAWLAHGSKGVLLTPSEAVAETAVPGGSNSLKPDTEHPRGADNWSRRSSNARKRDKKRKASEMEDKDTNTKGKSKGKGKGKTQLCFAWNNNNGACAGLPPGSDCKGRVRREHRCTACGSPGHPSHQCKQKDS
eukprot:s2086_g17.t1